MRNLLLALIALGLFANVAVNAYNILVPSAQAKPGDVGEPMEVRLVGWQLSFFTHPLPVAIYEQTGGANPLKVKVVQ